jgi:alpha-D-ribose 1-methylphosphonate 5-triphosphate synthase subunit PhnG
MEIIALKLITGEDILGEIDSQSETEFVIVNPVGITVVRGKDGQPNIGFSPFPLHAEQKTGATVALAKKHVVYSYVPAEDFVKNYNQIFGSGLVVPPQKQIITG